MTDKACYDCGTTEKELRPYGPNGSWVCFACAMSTPEREKQTDQMMELMMGSSGGVLIIDGSDTGPYSLEHASPEIQALVKEALAQLDDEVDIDIDSGSKPH
jgi:hypothetical protein